jgi:single-strand DNA-binding protein
MSFNCVFLIGNMVKDPELQTIPSGASVCKFTIALNHKIKDREPEVLFVDITTWAKTAEFVAQYFKKGKPIMIEGRLKMDSWMSKETGKQVSKLTVIAEKVHFVPSDNTGAYTAQPDNMLNPSKHIATQRTKPFEAQSKKLAADYAEGPQKSIDSNLLDSEELPF